VSGLVQLLEQLFQSGYTDRFVERQDMLQDTVVHATDMPKRALGSKSSYGGRLQSASTGLTLTMLTARNKIFFHPIAAVPTL
jgi:hypothetical protein